MWSTSTGRDCLGLPEGQESASVEDEGTVAELIPLPSG
jgi:hypothetical protein